MKTYPNLSIEYLNTLSEEILSNPINFKHYKNLLTNLIHNPEDLIIISEILFAKNKETLLLNSLCKIVFNYKINDFYSCIEYSIGPVDKWKVKDYQKLSLMAEMNFLSLTESTIQKLIGTKKYKELEIQYDSILKFNPSIEKKLTKYKNMPIYCHYFIHQKNFNYFLSPIFSSNRLDFTDITDFFDFWERQNISTNKNNLLSDYFKNDSSLLNNVIYQFETSTFQLSTDLNQKKLHYLKNNLISFVNDDPIIFNKIFNAAEKFCNNHNINFHQFTLSILTANEPLVHSKKLGLITKKISYDICQRANIANNPDLINNIFINYSTLFEKNLILKKHLVNASLSLEQLFFENIDYMIKNNLFDIGQGTSIINLKNEDEESFLRPSIIDMGDSLSNQILNGYSFLQPMLSHHELQKTLPPNLIVGNNIKINKI